MSNCSGSIENESHFLVGPSPNLLDQSFLLFAQSCATRHYKMGNKPQSQWTASTEDIQQLPVYGIEKGLLLNNWKQVELFV